MRRRERAGRGWAALCVAAVLLIAGCGGGDSEKATGSQTGTATQPAAEKAQPAAVEAALKARLEATLPQFVVESTVCTPVGEGFTCRVRALHTGQRRSGRMRLTPHGSVRAYVGKGTLAGPGGSFKISRILIDLDQPAPAKPPPTPGRSPLEDAIEATLENSAPQLIVTRLRCPDESGKPKGTRFTCRGAGPYGVSPATIVVNVTQTDDAGTRFVLNGDITFRDPAGRTGHGTFRNVKVIVPASSP